MNIENDIFKRMKINKDKLIEYGFIKNEDNYRYSKKILNSNFRVDIVIDKDIKGKIYDLDMNEEYTNFRIEKQNDAFVNTVREEYINILKDIAHNCFEKEYFITEQANRITNKINELYNNIPEFVWEKSPGNGIFRNPDNQKWYALIMNINGEKIGLKKGEIEIINIKTSLNEIDKLLKINGIFPAYHMNKQNWITIILNDSISDKEIINYIIESHKYTETPDEWIIPANPKYYDIITAFDNSNIMNWKQSSNIKVNDIIYIYLGSPYSSILYKCKALEVNIPYHYDDGNLSMKYVMKLKLLSKYDRGKYDFKKLKEYGVRAVRGPRFMPKELSKEINKK